MGLIPLRSLKCLAGHPPVVQSSRRGAEKDCWESWGREHWCSEKKFRALLVQMSQTKAELYSRVKPRERVKA